jgi:hypothetical protein
MKKILNLCVASCFVCLSAYGQDDAPSNYEHLKCFDQVIGNWVYEGPATEDVEGVVKKGQPIKIRLSYRWVLDKNAIETNISGEVNVEGGFKMAIKGMIVWDAKNEQIIDGSADSLGGHSLATVVYDKNAKTFTTTSQGVTGTGEDISSRTVLTIKEKNAVVVQVFDRKGGFAEGDGPALTYKRVARNSGERRRKKTSN